MHPFYLPILLFAFGIALVVKGGNLFVDAARWISDVTHIPRFIIGATVVSLATALPEMLVSLIATLKGSVGMGVGSAIGSVSANLGLTMGACLLLMPASRVDKILQDKALLMLGSTLVLWVLCLDGRLTVAEGLVLMGLLAVFIFTSIIGLRTGARQSPAHPYCVTRGEAALHLFKFAAGTAGILWGAQLLVDNGTRLARILGVPQRVIGITLIAVGTSLPELITAAAALSKNEAALSVGNILGACTIDITLILAACAFVTPGGLPVDPQTIGLSLPVTLVLMGIAVLPPLLSSCFYRIQGLIMLAAYMGYLAVIAAGTG